MLSVGYMGPILFTQLAFVSDLSNMVCSKGSKYCLQNVVLSGVSPVVI